MTKVDTEAVTGVRQDLVRNSMRSFDNKKKASEAKAAVQTTVAVSGDAISEKRQTRWMTLLAKRPSTKDGDSMSAWLMEVLAVSDLDTPLKANEDITTVSHEKDSLPHKKSADTAGSESAGSDIGYGSSNDDSAVNGGNKEHDVKAPSGDFNGGIVKKKRHLELDPSTMPKPSSDPYASGSFAEWKERKKQKKAMKETTLKEEV